MTPLINRYATPLTVGLFAVSAVSGAALFFHVQQGAFHAMHEWLSMLLLLPVALHVWRNWGALLGYLRRHTLLLPVVATLLAAVVFAVVGLSGGGGGGSPPMRAAQLLTQVPLVRLAPVLKTTPEALQAQLRQRGYTVGSADDTLNAVAAASGASGMQVLVAVLPAP